MAAVIATERRLRTRMPGRELVVQNVVNWRTVRGYGELWRGRSGWVGWPRRKAGGGRGRNPHKRGNQGVTRAVTATSFLKQLAGPKKNNSSSIRRSRRC